MNFYKIILVILCINALDLYSINEKRVLVTSIPKSGTHMLRRCVDLITGFSLSRIMTPSYIFINPYHDYGLYLKHVIYVEENIKTIEDNFF